MSRRVEDWPSWVLTGALFAVAGLLIAVALAADPWPKAAVLTYILIP